MKKRIQCLILCVCIALSLLEYPVFASESNETPIELQIAVDLGLLDASAPGRANEVMTRGEFVNALMKLIGASGSDRTELTDVTEKSKYYSSICAAYSLGYIKGYEDGTFRENEPMIQSAAVRLLTYVVGCRELLDVGLSVGKAAQSAKICNFAEAVSSNGITVKKAAEFLVNTADSLTVDVKSIGDEDADYYFSEVTVLEKYRNIHRYTGVVMANEFTYLNEDNAVSENCVIVGDLFLKEGDTRASELLGYNALIYYLGEKNTEGGTIISALPYRNEVVKIDSENDAEYNNGVLTYYVNGNKRSVRFDITAVDMIYNNKLTFSPSKKDFDISSGNITVIDNNNDEIYDVVKILSYDTFVVDSVNKTNGKAYGKWGSGVIDFVETENISFVSENGDRMDVLELAEWDVLSVAKSKDEKVLSVIYNLGMVEGEISAYEIEDDKYRLTIDDSVYDTSEYFYLNQSYEVKNGIGGLFYLDIDGRIAAANFSATAKHSFGYLMAAAPKNAMRSEVEVKLMNENSEKIITSFAKRVILNGKSVKTESSDTVSMLTGLSPQLVIYGLDSNGCVNYLDTAYIENDGTITNLSKDENYQNSLCMYYDGFESGTKLQYRYTSKVFGAKIAASSNTLVFEIPTEPSNEENDYWVYSLPEYIEENDQKCLQAYKTNSDSLTAEVIVIRKDTKTQTSVPNSVGISVVENVKKALDEEGNYSYKLTVYTGKRKLEYMTVNDDIVENYTLNGEKYAIKAGDVIQFTVDIRGKISNCKLIYSMTKDAMNGANPSSSTFLDRFRVQRAFVYRKYKNNFITTTTELLSGKKYSESELETLEMRTLDNYAVLWYDSENKRVSVVGQNNLVGFVNSGNTEASKVVIYDRDGDGRTMVIYD